MLHRQQMILNSIITRSHLCTGSILKPSKIWLQPYYSGNRHVVKCALVDYLPEPRGPCASDFGSTLMFKENGRWVLYPKRDIYKKYKHNKQVVINSTSHFKAVEDYVFSCESSPISRNVHSSVSQSVSHHMQNKAK